MAEKLVHLHIPKTAGTSLRRALIDTYGAREVFYYDTTRDRAIRSNLRITGSERGSIDKIKSDVHAHRLFKLAKPLFRIAKAGEVALSVAPETLVQRDFSSLSGHFSGEDLRAWGLADEKVVTMVRNPLVRMWSQYRHWQRTEGFAFGKSHIAYSDDVGFDEYSAQPEVANYQSSLLESCRVDVAATPETLPELMEELGLVGFDNAPKLNAGQTSEMPIFDNGFLKDFESMNARDYELYYRVCEFWDKQPVNQ